MHIEIYQFWQGTGTDSTRLVCRSQNFDLNNLDQLRRRILELRKVRNIGTYQAY